MALCIKNIIFPVISAILFLLSRDRATCVPGHLSTQGHCTFSLFIPLFLKASKRLPGKPAHTSVSIHYILSCFKFICELCEASKSQQKTVKELQQKTVALCSKFLEYHFKLALFSVVHFTFAEETVLGIIFINPVQHCLNNTINTIPY